MPNSIGHHSEWIADLQASIRQRLKHQVQSIAIRQVGNALLVGGVVDSFYGCQLINAECSKAIASHPSYNLDCEMKVTGGDE